MVWGIDLVSALPTGKGGVRYAVVAIDYFTKWAEAKPLATITSKRVLDFVVKSIICWLGLPKKIVSDNGTQFDSDLFTEFCERYDIEKSFSSVAYPQANGQVEVVNKTLKASIKKRLDEAKGVLPEQLPQVLWAYRTSHRTPTGHTPFSVAFGSEAVLPVEVKVASYRVQAFDQDRNHELLYTSLDLIDERREDS